jgi:hypothetical protein
VREHWAHSHQRCFFALTVTESVPDLKSNIGVRKVYISNEAGCPLKVPSYQVAPDLALARPFRAVGPAYFYIGLLIAPSILKITRKPLSYFEVVRNEHMFALHRYYLPLQPCSQIWQGCTDLMLRPIMITEHIKSNHHRYQKSLDFGTGDRRALEEALKAYRSARTYWAEVADRAKGVYASDLSASDRFSERGQWLDRLSGIDQDIARLEQRLASAQETQDQQLEAAIAEILTRPRRASAKCRHQPPAGFRPKEPVDIALAIEGRALSSACLYYRHVNQAERFQKIEMKGGPSGYRAQIPGTYTDSPYPLQYYFELKETPKKAWLYPGFTADRTNQPYFVLRQS